jgi:hypothetical protein
MDVLLAACYDEQVGARAARVVEEREVRQV